MRFLVPILLFLLASVSVISAQPVVFIVRHAEKATNDAKDPDLSGAGRKRAQILAGVLKNAAIAEIFTTEFKRTKETAAPVAKELRIAPTVVPAKEIGVLVSKLRHLNGNALVVGHGNTIPDIIKALGLDIPVNIPETDYTEFLVVILAGKPELLRLHYP